MISLWLAAAFFILLAASLALNFRLYMKARHTEADKRSYEETLEQSKTRQKAMDEIFNELYDHIYFHDLAGNFYEFNATLIRNSDYTEAEFKQMNIRDLVPEPYKSRVDTYLEQIRSEGRASGIMRTIGPNGKIGFYEYNCALVYDERGEPMGVRGISRDITEQMHARRAMKESEKKYRGIIETIEDGYYEVDLKGNYQFVNSALLRMLGYSLEEIIGKSYKEIIAPGQQSEILETFNYVYQTGRPVKSFDWEVIGKDGHIIHEEASVSLQLDDQGRPVGFKGIVRDISERLQAEKKQKELESQLHQAQKMESIGTLAGGIAHDFNNILFPIIGYTELALQDLPAESPPSDYLGRVLTSANRAKALVQQILTFSRQQTEAGMQPEYIQPVIKETLKLLKNTIPANIEITAAIAEETDKVVINPAHIHQVFMNLCTNAYQAMQDEPAGKLSVQLDQIRIDMANSPGHHHLTPGRYIRLLVSDTGCGIEPEIKDKIFDPYFTTKPQDRGTGLGLSVSYGIIKNAGGTIQIDSSPDAGSRVIVYLPVSDQLRDSTETQAQPRPLPCGSEHVLLVDDEKHIMELEKQVLENLGYRITARTSSVEALEAFQAAPMRFDILVTDQTMPNMSGINLVKAARQLRSDLPAILCTGYSERMIHDKLEAAGIQAVLLKPIANSDLAVTLRNVLDSRINHQSQAAINGSKSSPSSNYK
mgnify:CR=1 FL=1